MVPPLLNDFISLQKDTALLSSIFVFEALFAAQDYAAYNFNYTPIVVVAVLFVALTIPLARFTDWVGRADDAPRAGRCPMSEVGACCAPRTSARRTATRSCSRDIDLVVEPHDVVCLIGSSGSGKSTLLRCLDLLEDIDDGAIFFEGQDISDPLVDSRAVRRRMGVVFQAYNLFPHLSVLDNVTLAPRKVHGVDRASRGGQGDASCSPAFGLADKAASTPTGCPAASSSGSRWPARWPPTRRCCCSTR